MKTILNKTHKPMKISIGGGRFLHLGPSKTGQISDQASGSPAVCRLVKAGEIEVLGEEPSVQGRPAPAASGHGATHGHPQPTVVLPKGNR